MRARVIALSIGAVLIQALAPVSPAQAADPVTATFNYTGIEQSWVVPAGVTSIDVVLVGGQGGSGSGATSGGDAARVTGTLAVAPGTTLFLRIGGNGSDGATVQGGASPFNGGGAGGSGSGGGGGSGGGATDIRTLTGAAPGSLDSRLIVAAGGGGGGGGSTAGTGGDAGQQGSSVADATGGLAGTSTAGGIGGTPSGDPGALGIGGRGAFFCFAGCVPPAGGGGGGGGHYGGGGGGGTSAAGAAGGGGGSSYLGDATGTSVTSDASGIPSISITHDVDGSPTGAVDAIVTMASSAVCVELSTTAIDFGTRQFGDVGAAGTPSIGITNCGGVTESILARGTHATGPDAAWALVDAGSCVDETLMLDQYRLRLFNTSTEDELALTTTNQALDALAAGAAASHTALMDTPCPGSTGAGAVMSMQILFVATEEVVP